MTIRSLRWCKMNMARLYGAKGKVKVSSQYVATAYPSSAYQWARYVNSAYADVTFVKSS